MSFEDYKDDLKTPLFDDRHIEDVLDRYFHSGIPHFCDGDSDYHGRFRRNIANSIQSTFGVACHPLEVVVCGSAHLGFSPSPSKDEKGLDKLGKLFDINTSDIDVAVVLPELFDRCWLEIQKDSKADELPSVREDYLPTIADDLLNGFINPSKVRIATDVGTKWWNLFRGLTPERGGKVRGRMYRSHWFMQGYHRLTITRGRDVLQGSRS